MKTKPTYFIKPYHVVCTLAANEERLVRKRNVLRNFAFFSDIVHPLSTHHHKNHTRNRPLETTHYQLVNWSLTTFILYLCLTTRTISKIAWNKLSETVHYRSVNRSLFPYLARWLVRRSWNWRRSEVTKSTWTAVYKPMNILRKKQINRH